MPTLIDFNHGISAIDSEFLRPLLDAIHLVVEDGKAAIGDAEARHIFLREGMRELLVSAALAHGCPLRGERLLEILEIDVELNAQGLGIWLAEIERSLGS
jgi:hypothetical protein